MDCPSDVATYIHRVGRTARYNAGGKAVLFLEPSEIKMVEKLQDAKIPIIAKSVMYSTVLLSRLFIGSYVIFQGLSQFTLLMSQIYCRPYL